MLIELQNKEGERCVGGDWKERLGVVREDWKEGLPIFFLFLSKTITISHMYTVFFHHIVIVFVRNVSQYGEKIVYTYVYHIVSYLGNFEALYEITDLVHEMLSVCARLRYIHTRRNKHVHVRQVSKTKARSTNQQ